MKGPSDSVIRKALVRWAKAKIRMAEVTLGPDLRGQYMGAPEAAARRDEMLWAECALLALGNRALIAAAKPMKVRP